MNKQDRELLLKDLCARLPYGVRIETGQSSSILYNIRPDTLVINDLYDISIIKPYLRPMSSMTKEENNEYEILIDCSDYTYFKTSDKVIDWLNEHHFDYRGLIEKGLALEAPEDMYSIQ